MIQARDAETRIVQKLGEYLQRERQTLLLGGGGDDEFAETMKSAMEQYEDQVIRKEIVAAELDCHHAPRAIQDVIGLERQRQLKRIRRGAAQDGLPLSA